MSHIHRNMLIYSLILSEYLYPMASVIAQDQGDQLNTYSSESAKNSVTEFVYRNNQNEVLMSVSLLGAVKNPGIYNVPVNTNLLTLITIAGGYTDSAKPESLIIRSLSNPNKYKLVDMNKVLYAERKFTPPVMMPNDVIFVDARKPFFSQDTITGVGIVSSILGVIVTGLVLSNALSKK